MNMTTKYLLAPTLLGTLSATTALHGASVDPAVNTIVGTEPSGMTAGDFDNDGDVDLATLVDNPDRVVLLLNDGAGNVTVVAGPLLGASSSPQDLIATDLNGDGLVDLAVAIRDPQGSVVHLRNSGGASFTNLGATTVGDRPRGMSAADADNDGDMDLAVANRDDGTVSVLTNTGAGFSVATFALGGESRDTAWGDIDNDGDMDLAATNSDGRSIHVFQNTGGVLSPLTILSVAPFVRPEGVAMGDLNGDGRADIAAATSDDTFNISEAAVFLSQGAAFTGPARFDTGGSNVSDVTIADIDCDGAPDLVVSNQDSNSIAVLVNNGAGGFVLDVTAAAATRPDELATGDLDGDGDLDIAVAARDANAVSVFNNTSCAAVVPCPQDCAPVNPDGSIGNGLVNFDDIIAVVNDFGAGPSPCDVSPDNGDGTFGDGSVNIDDLLSVIDAFGACP